MERNLRTDSVPMSLERDNPHTHNMAFHIYIRTGYVLVGVQGLTFWSIIAYKFLDKLIKFVLRYAQIPKINGKSKSGPNTVYELKVEENVL
jgi:hypothetical protein